MRDVEIAPLPVERFESVLDPHPYQEFCRSMQWAAERSRGRTLWCVNSTPKGGGVAEMLASLLGYLTGAGIEARWVVIEGDEEFFALTKRIHNRLHGESGDGGPLGEGERALYERALAPNLRELAERVGPRDVVIVHDPQPAGLIPGLRGAAGAVLWRCHIGVDTPNDAATQAWDFLRPFVEVADACVFSRRAYVWSGLDHVAVIPPSIDAFSLKNRSLDAVEDVLAAAGVTGRAPSGPAPAFERPDGTEGSVRHRADLVEEEPLPDSVPLVVQVSRWDRLKGHLGVLQGFAAHVPSSTGAHLVLAGPEAEGVADDPEAKAAFEEVGAAWRELPPEQRGRIHIASLPTKDDDENSIIVNAIQRRADVVAQKSLAEGFGLTVAEAMWKERPVVASRVGGIQDQIEHGESGLLIDDPEDDEAFGRAVTELLEDPERARTMGAAACQRVREEFLASRHLVRWTELLEGLDRKPRARTPA
jgi:trehalose synthase